jgi:hypothetical protein
MRKAICHASWFWLRAVRQPQASPTTPIPWSFSSYRTVRQTPILGRREWSNFPSIFQARPLPTTQPMALQSDGKLVVLATVSRDQQTLNTDLGLARLLADGTTDGTFGNLSGSGTPGPGHAIVAFDVNLNGGADFQFDVGRAIALTADDSLLIAGEAMRIPPDHYAFALAKLTPNAAAAAPLAGQIDGKILARDVLGGPCPGYGLGTLYGMAIESDGAPILIGDDASYGVEPCIVRVQNDGTIDRPFSGFERPAAINGSLSPVNVAFDDLGHPLITYRACRDLPGGAENCDFLLQRQPIDGSFGIWETTGSGSTLASFDLVGPANPFRNSDYVNAFVPLRNGRALLIGSAQAGTSATDTNVAVTRIVVQETIFADAFEN